MAPSRLEYMTFFGVQAKLFVLISLALQWPEGDPDGSREAARLWRSIAKRVDDSLRETDGVAEAVWKGNKGEGVSAFEDYWKGRVRPYPPQVSAYARGLGKVCDDYAVVVEDTQKKVIRLAIVSFLEMLMFMAWPQIGAFTNMVARRAMRKAQGALLLRIAEYIAGSLFYTLADEAIVVGSKLAFGEDLGSLEDNLTYMGKNFAAAMVFYGVDPANAPRVAKILPKNPDLNQFVVFLAGSSVFTTTGNVLNRPGDFLDDPLSLLPTWDQMISKILVGGGQLGGKSGTPKAENP
ncbi:hypothetical protein AB0B45_16920 [Nonomuraea sp. NPDC049152]|uniref:WXG100-like domain-containing protein n=1 Tax=Nonomuraea sp. NPDC049152 TaxID=3154350 RepID=UPI0034055BDF